MEVRLLASHSSSLNLEDQCIPLSLDHLTTQAPPLQQSRDTFRES